MIRKIFRYFLLLLGLLAVIFFAYQGYVLMRLWWWVDHNPTMTAFMHSRLIAMRETNTHATLKHQWVSYGGISKYLKQAVIAAEDAKFTDHDGFDWDGIQKALEKNQKKGKVVAGGSTISQQLAKNLFLSGERNFFRKGEEALITLMMEQVMGKERILEIYLNVIEWGQGVFGVEAAARHYYGLSAMQLDAEQSAKLAAMVPRPRYYEMHRNSSSLLKRTQTIIMRMPQVHLP